MVSDLHSGGEPTPFAVVCVHLPGRLRTPSPDPDSPPCPSVGAEVSRSQASRARNWTCSLSFRVLVSSHGTQRGQRTLAFPQVTFLVWQVVQRRGGAHGECFVHKRPLKLMAPSKLRFPLPPHQLSCSLHRTGVRISQKGLSMCQVSFEPVTRPCPDRNLTLPSHICV